MNVKDELLKHCKDQVNQRMSVCLERIQSIERDLANESKSSAGDKHETGRAMLQLEREKLGTQLHTIEKELTFLERMNTKTSFDTVGIGSIVKTTKFNYYILISADIIEIKNENYLCISSHSPIGQLLLGKEVGDETRFNDLSFKINDIQ